MLGKSAAEFTDVGDSGHFASAHDRDRPMSLHLLEDRRHQLDVFSGSIVELESVSISLTLSPPISCSSASQLRELCSMTPKS